MLHRWEEYPFHVADRGKFQPQEVLSVASELLVTIERELMKYLGARVVFFDLRQEFLSSLYLPRVSARTLTHALEPFRALKSGICGIGQLHVLLSCGGA